MSEASGKSSKKSSDTLSETLSDTSSETLSDTSLDTSLRDLSNKLLPMEPNSSNREPLHNEPLKQKFLQNLDQDLQAHWSTTTPGLKLKAYHQGHEVLQYEGGTVYRFYDLASLTKVLFTVPAMMMAHQKKLWDHNTKVQEILPWWSIPQTKIVDLLTHTSGLIWWKPFFQSRNPKEGPSLSWQALQSEIQLELESIDKTSVHSSVYSDVGFMVLAYVLETFYSCSLLEVWNLWKNYLESELGLSLKLHWIPTVNIKSILRPYKQGDYAPTENCSWRSCVIQGEVHDENAWALGGISTHAGLFGTPDDVAAVFLFYRQVFLDSLHPWHPSLKCFIQRQTPKEIGDWGLGFMFPTEGSSSSGAYFSKSSVGHTGFTGTSVWWDIENDDLVILLSNRTLYGREKREFAKLRTLLHDKIISFIRYGDIVK